jgi:desulfoferrodoxin (superoxide reductase-like protein)
MRIQIITPLLSHSISTMSAAEISRRKFCAWSSSLVLAGMFDGLKSRLALALDPSPEALKELHTPKLILPAVTRNGTHVPVAVKMNHPMRQNHYIRQIQFVNETDPIPSKGIFYPTIANGEIYFSFQARMHSGTSTMMAIAECNLHGRWTARQRLTIPEGQGGCATAEPGKTSRPPNVIVPPVIRIPELVRRGHLPKGTTTEVQVKFKHPSKTGLIYENKKFNQVEEPFYLTSMEVLYGDRLVSRYEMTAGLSDNPFITLKLKLTEERPIQIVFTNSLGQQFRSVQELVLS